MTLIFDPALDAHRLGPFRAAHRRQLPQVVPQAAPLERRVPVREVRARVGRAADPDVGVAGRAADARRAGPHASRGSWRSATSCSRNRRAGCGSAAGSPTRATGSAARWGSSRGTRIGSATCGRRESPARRSRACARCSRAAVAVASGRASSPAAARPSVPAAPRPQPRSSRSRRMRATTSSRRRRASTSRSTRRSRTRTTTRAPTRTYFDTAYLAVLPGTANFAASSPGAEPSVSVRQPTHSYTLLTIELGRRLFAGKRTPLRLQFDLPDRGGTALRDVRVGASLVAFPVWAFATDDTPGSSVTVVFPPGYNVQQQVGSLPRPDGRAPAARQIYASGPLDDAARVLRVLRGRPAGSVRIETQVSVAGGRHDGAGHGPRLVRRPGVGHAGGVAGEARAAGACDGHRAAVRGTGLVVQESVSRTIGGYAGIFDPVAADDPGRLLRGSVRRAARDGPRLVQRPARVRPLDPRRRSRPGTRQQAAAALKIDADAARADAGPARGGDPA